MVINICSTKKKTRTMENQNVNDMFSCMLKLEICIYEGSGLFMILKWINFYLDLGNCLDVVFYFWKFLFRIGWNCSTNRLRFDLIHRSVLNFFDFEVSAKRKNSWQYTWICVEYKSKTSEWAYRQTPYAETEPNAMIANVVPTNIGAVSSRYVPEVREIISNYYYDWIVAF